MKPFFPFALLLLFVVIPVTNSHGQNSSEFDLQAYQQFLEEHSNLSYEGLIELYPSNDLLSESPADFSRALYADTVQRYYQLNDPELEQLEKQSFVVSDRIRYKSFGEAFFTIYKRDLPVYLSSDAILHALHMSYSDILIRIENQELIPRLERLLRGLHNTLPELEERYGDDPVMKQSLTDLDLYLTIPRILLGDEVSSFYEENEPEVETLLEMVDSETMQDYPLFAPVNRSIDFSQFIPRGHYTQTRQLTRYFQAMIWLGRTEFYLIVPKSMRYNMLTEDERNRIGRRQTIASYLLKEALGYEDNNRYLKEMDRVVTFLTGESDNVNEEHLAFLQQKTGFEHAGSLSDMETYLAFKQKLEQAPFASQRILSQILKTDPTSPEKITPASAYLLLGQRFIIDSFVMGNVVYDKVSAPNRMLPKSADVLFALGNNDALDVLKDELDYYNYETELVALRHLIDSYEPEYWNTSFFNMWLNAIRKLNPAEDRSPLPEFMQTEAWSRKNMNTQLASWAQLRHDNLLYAKQSYTGGPICSYPQSYVEPVPRFFHAIETLAIEAQKSFGNVLDDGYLRNNIIRYFENLEEISGKLAEIARKHREGIDTTPEEKAFLQEMLHESQVCGVELTGWYKDLYFTGDKGALEEDFIVADVHTSPYDEQGGRVGWVYHVGTGPLNLAVLTADLGDGETYAFVGPVMSFYEHVSVNFKRLTDEEWVDMFEEEPTMRPEFTESYLVNSGTFYYDHRSYVVSADDTPLPEAVQRLELRQNYPNPFNNATTIAFRIPSSMTDSPVKLRVFNVQGQLVETLIDRPMPAGNYTVRWEGNAASGTYYYQLEVGGQVKTGSMTLVK